VRALIDTNLLIANLLSEASATSAVGVIFQAALADRFTLLLPVVIMEELDRNLLSDPVLATRVARADADALITILSTVAELVPLLPEPYPEVGRDRKDDFLIVHSVIAKAAYLVSWDKDLLTLEEIEGIHIVSPPAFSQVLRAADLL
jgi:putative PIN family toxin of toxin-antitoxin system